jgi:hypothetical protein
MWRFLVHFQDPVDNTRHELAWEHTEQVGEPFSAGSLAYAVTGPGSACPASQGRTTVVAGRDWRSGGAPPGSGPLGLLPGRAVRLGEQLMPPEGARS